MVNTWKLHDPLYAIRHMTVDGSLLLSPYALAEVRLPFAPSPALRMGPGALLLASAVTVTAEQAAARHVRGLLDAVKPLGFSQEKFLARCPIQQAVEHGFIVQDGKGQRAYFADVPARLFAACASVYDGKERPITPEDAALLPKEALNQYAFAMAPVTDGQIGPKMYLGSLTLRAAVQPALLQALSTLGLPITVLPGDTAPEHADALRSLSTGQAEGPTLHIGLNDAKNCFIPSGADWPQTVVQAVMKSRKKLHLAWGVVSAATLMWLTLLGLFLNDTAPDALWPGLAMMLCAGACIRWPLAALGITAVWITTGIPAIPGLFCIVGGLLGGLAARKLFMIFR